MKWMRPNRIGGKTTTLYHLPREGEHCSQDYHYFQTRCRTELKTVYNNWDIKDDPPKEECCPKCMKAWRERT
jgi:hypothetical protein